MTARTNTERWMGIKGKARALAAGVAVAGMLGAGLLAPSPAQASAFPGVNGKIAFASNRTTGTGVDNPEGDFEIFSINPDGTGLKQLTKNTASESSPSYSGDGKKIAFESNRAGNSDIFAMNSDGTGQTNLTKSASAQDTAPSYSPDGKKITYASLTVSGGVGGPSDIFVMNSDGTGQTNLTKSSTIEDNPTFSPDGKKIAFDNRSGQGGIFVMNFDGTNPTNLTPGTGTAEGQPAFSPDGTKIAFASNSSGQGDVNDFDVFVMKADGTGIVRLTNSRARDDEPAFSPDGKKVAYVSTRDGGDRDPFVMDAIAGDATQTGLALNAKDDFEPDWQPTASTFTVTTASDTGDGTCDSTCTLREAINASNAAPGSLQNAIRFNISGNGVQTITPSSPLPTITRAVIVDGYTQPGSSPNTLAVGDNAVLNVELNGANVGGATGLQISHVSGSSTIRGLVINRFGEGIDIFDDTVGNRIEGNFIGTDPTGTLDRGNLDHGVNITNSASENVIGGTTPAARNVISGNACNAVFVDDASTNRVEGNYVGTDKTGAKALPNGGDLPCSAVVVIGNSSGNTVGGTTAGARNVVSGNKFEGIEILSATHNEVLGNRIGTTANGASALGNGDAGVLVQGSDNLVGDGTAAGSNTIAFNGDDGVEVQSGTGSAVSRNSIFSNTGLGIDLHGGFEDPSGNTANDPGDIDTGPNGLQNKPVISSAKSSSTKTTVTGKLASVPDTLYRIEFYSNPSGDEGKNFLGSKLVTTGSDGNVLFTFSPASKVATGLTVTATARAEFNEITAVGTSEFSAPKTVALASASALSPETTKVSGPSGLTKNPTAHFEFYSPDKEAAFECSLDGGAYYECSSPENINRLSEGRHLFEVRAVDQEGDADPTPAEWIWSVQRKAPSS